MLLVSALRFAQAWGWLKTTESSGMVAVLYAFSFNYWLRHALHVDLKERLAAARKDKALRRRLSSGGAMSALVYFFAYGAAIFLPGLVLIPWLAANSTGDAGQARVLAVLFVVESVLMLIMAAPFGSVLLVLPARLVGMSWGPGDAYRAAQGIRGKLVAIAILCSLISVIGAFAAVILTAIRLPDGPLGVAIGRGLTILADLLALYVLSYVVGRLFVASTGWKPEPLAILA